MCLRAGADLISLEKGRVYHKILLHFRKVSTERPNLQVECALCRLDLLPSAGPVSFTDADGYWSEIGLVLGDRRRVGRH